MKLEPGFRVFQKDGMTGIENTTKYNLLVSIKPIKPKRKYIDVILVPPDSFKLFTQPDFQMDLTKISFTLEEPYKEETCDT